MDQIHSISNSVIHIVRGVAGEKCDVMILFGLIKGLYDAYDAFTVAAEMSEVGSLA